MFPSHNKRIPDSDPDKTFPSGSCTYPTISLNSDFPNFPISPCSFKPVKVSAIFQNFMSLRSQIYYCAYLFFCFFNLNLIITNGGGGRTVTVHHKWCFCSYLKLSKKIEIEKIVKNERSVTICKLLHL
jgi:hypothetical protein